MEKLERVGNNTKRKICKDCIVGGVTGAISGATKGAAVGGVPGAVACAIGGAAIGVMGGATTAFIDGTREQNKVLADNTNNPQQLERINTSNKVLDAGEAAVKIYKAAINIDKDKCIIM